MEESAHIAISLEPAAHFARQSVGRAPRVWRSERVWLIPAAALFGWLAFFAFILPYDHDEAVYSILATGMLDGSWPYRDLWDNKPPLIYVWNLPGALTASLEVQRLFGILLGASSVGALAVVARRWLRGRQVVLAAWAYALFLANPYIGLGTTIETYVLLPLLVAMAIPSAFFAGVLLAVAAMTKPTALIFLPVLLAVWKQQSWRTLAGLAVTGLLLALPFVAVWRDLWTANVSFNLEFGDYGVREYGGGQRVWQLLGMRPEVVIGSLAIWLAALAGAPHLRNPIIWLWIVCGVFALKSNGYTTGFEYSHYYTLLAPPLAIVAALGLEALLVRIRARIVLIAAACFSLAIIGSAVGLTIANPDDDRAALIRAVETTDGEFYMLGGTPQLYAETQRQPERRFFFNIPLIVREAWGDKTRTNLVACPPNVLVVNIKGDRRSLFEVPWSGEIQALYATRREFGKFALLTDPIRPCDL